jgi:hypothetical protein
MPAALPTIDDLRDALRDAYVRGALDLAEKIGPLLARLDSLDAKDVLTVAQAAAVAGKDRKTILRWRKDGLPMHQAPGVKGLRLYRSDLDRFLAGSPEGDGASTRVNVASISASSNELR